MSKVLIVCALFFASLSAGLSQSSDAGNAYKVIKSYEEKGWGLRKTYPDSTIFYADLIIDELRAMGDTSSIAKYYNFKGIGNYYKGDNYTSYNYYALANEVAELLGDSVQLGHAMNNLGRFFLSQGNYMKSYDYSNQALDVFKGLKNNDGIAYSLKRISEVYLAQGYLSKALSTSKQILEIRLSQPNKNAQATAYIDLAHVYLEMDSLDQSYKYYRSAYERAQEIANDVLIATSQLGLSELNNKKSAYDSALFYVELTKKTALSINNQNLLIQALVQMGKSYFYAERLSEAKVEFERIIDISVASNQLAYQREAYYYLAKINARFGNGMKAYEYQIQFDELDKLLSNVADKRAIDSLLFQTEIKLRANENELLLINNEKDQLLIESHQWKIRLMIVMILMVLIALVIIYVSSRKTRHANVMLQRRNQEISRQKEEISANLEQKQALEQQLIISNEKLKGILNSGHVSIISTDTEGMITHFSKGAESQLGYSAEEMVNKQTPAILHKPEEVIARGEELSKAYGREIRGYDVFVTLTDEQGYESKEWTYIKKDGQEFPVQLVVSQLMDRAGKVNGYLGIATDISQQKHIEEQLRIIGYENEHYRDILESVEDIIYELDGKGCYKYVNPGTCQLSGYSQEELSQMHYLDLIPEKDRGRVEAFYADQIKAKQTTNRYEFAVKTKAGDEFWVRQTTTMFYDADGRLSRILAIAQNINEIQELKLQLDAQLDLYKLVSENSQDFIALHDLEGHYQYISPSVKKLLGYSPEEMMHKNPYDFIHEDDHERLKHGPHLQTKQGRSIKSIIYRLRNKEGTYVWFEAYTAPVFGRDNEVISFQTSSRDITKRIKEQEKVKRYQNGLRLINGLSTDVNNSFDELLETSLKVVSEYFHLELGIISKIKKEEYAIKSYYSSKETTLSIGQQFDFKDTYCDITFSNNAVTAISEMGRSVYKRHPCYQHFGLESYIGAIIYVNNEKYGTVNFSSTDKRPERFDELDDDFLVLYANWVGANIQRNVANEQLKQEKEKAITALKIKSDFLSVMSHEIRTPLNGIIGLTNILMQERPRKDQIKNINLLKFSGDNLLVIINDILDFNKIEAGKISLESTDFNLYGLLESIQQTNAFKVHDKHVTLTLDYDDGLPHIFVGDSVRLGQIVNNLVSNAIKFTKEGTVQMKCSLMERSESNAVIEIKIIDTGKGIDNTKFDKIFKRFSQEEESTTRIYGGTGLGLPITKNLLNLMGSDIVLESTIGEGSTFSFKLKLPLGDQSLLKAPDPAVLKLNDLASYDLKILIAEDNDINYTIAANYLGQWHVASEQAMDGQRAVEMAQSTAYNLILMDLQMPKLDGYQATREIRKFNKDIPILALTASVLEEVSNNVRKVGMNDVICKPITPHELHQKITKHLNIIPKSGLITLVDEQRIKIESTHHIAAALEKMSMGDTTFTKELIMLCIADLQEFKKVMAASLQQKSQENAERIIHKVKTALTILELQSVEVSARQAVQAIIDDADTGNLELQIEDQVSEVISKLKLLHEELVNEVG